MAEAKSLKNKMTFIIKMHYKCTIRFEKVYNSFCGLYNRVILVAEKSGIL